MWSQKRNKPAVNCYARKMMDQEVASLTNILFLTTFTLEISGSVRVKKEKTESQRKKSSSPLPRNARNQTVLGTQEALETQEIPGNARETALERNLLNPSNSSRNARNLFSGSVLSTLEISSLLITRVYGVN